ncbi:hypothetical protein [Serinicoccus kebangsaanensis]|uniref:hypothetical protein n=1 Tax=Serinicoccus kebangsaanensis TaxID=2602069 RepID=UPI00124DFA7F|nr:hypothetical protein [Serinicoccus kebangsaanensis]
MGTIDLLFDQVRQAVETDGGGLTVERTDGGFDVCADVHDRRVVDVAYRAGVRELTIHHVAVDETEGTFTVTDDVRSVAWEAGIGGPRIALRASLSRSLGTFRRVELGSRWRRGADGRPEKVAGYAYDSAQGRRLVERVAEQMGLRQRMNTWAKVGLGFAAVGLLGALVAVVAAILVIRAT